MNRETAERLIRQLREVTVDRGATGPEAATAARKAAQLTDRYGLHELPRRTSPRPRPRPAPAAGFKGWTGGRIFDGAPREAWSFDAATGKASPNVKVHHYRDRANWRIELPT